MSLLDRGNESVVIFPEERTTSRDGNALTRPSTVGIPTRATIQPIGGPTDDTSAQGFDPSGPTRYRMRLARSFPVLLGRQSAVEWRGQRWSIIGGPALYGGSRRTAHVDYTIGRT